MAEIKRGWTDTQVDQRIGNLLRTGVIMSAVVVLLGGVLLLIQEGDTNPSNMSVFHGEPAKLRTFKGVLLDAVGLDARGIIQLGLLLLLATPVARVAFSVFAFSLQRDWMYVVITLIVLVVLVFSMAGGRL